MMPKTSGMIKKELRWWSYLDFSMKEEGREEDPYFKMAPKENRKERED